MGFEVDVLEARAAALERERDERARAAVEAERARIARELHDVIGHSISVMGVAGGRRAAAADAGAGARARGAALRRADRPRRGRRDAAAARASCARTAPSPSSTRCRRCSARTTWWPSCGAPGSTSSCRWRATWTTYRPAAALAAFRILQEALTNVLKHAPGAHVEAVLRRTASELEIEVVDSGGDAARRAGRRRRPRPGRDARARRALRRDARGRAADGAGFAVLARFPATGA